MEWGFNAIDWIKRFLPEPDHWDEFGWEDFIGFWIVPMLAGLLTYGFWKRRELSNPWEIRGFAFVILIVWAVHFSLPRVQY